MSTSLTIEQFHKVLPPQCKKSVNQEFIDQVNATLTDPILAESIRDNILGYAHVMRDGKFKMESYIDAVKYVSYKLMGDSNIAAYVKTFPDRYQRLVDNNVSDKDISSYVTIYNKQKLVNLIFEQTIIPSHVLNQDLYQKALNVQVELMTSANSEKVRCDAANAVLVALKAPETTKVKLDIGIQEGSIVEELRNVTRELAAQQRRLIESGVMSSQEVAHSKIVNVIDDAEYTEVTDAN